MENWKIMKITGSWYWHNTSDTFHLCQTTNIVSNLMSLAKASNYRSDSSLNLSDFTIKLNVYISFTTNDLWYNRILDKARVFVTVNKRTFNKYQNHTFITGTALASQMKSPWVQFQQLTQKFVKFLNYVNYYPKYPAIPGNKITFIISLFYKSKFCCDIKIYITSNQSFN